MSVIPLSAKDAIEREDAPTGTRPYGSGTTEVKADESSEKFDRIFEQAWAKLEPEIEANERPKPRKDIDTLISESTERAEAKEFDDADFAASRKARYELAERYGRVPGSSLKQTVQLFIDAYRAGKGDPAGTYNRIVKSYQGLQHSLKPNDGLPTGTKEEKFHDSDFHSRDFRRSNDKLDQILHDAIEYGDRERGEREEMEALKPALKELMPDLSFSEALDRILRIDEHLRKDPEGGGKMLYEMWGGREQQQFVAARDHLSAQIDQAAPQMPGLDALSDKVVDILNRPDFVRTNSPIADLQRAHAVVVGIEQRDAAVGGWAQSRLNQMPPELARMVERTLFEDATYKSLAARNVASRPFGDPVAMQMNFELAVGLAQEKMTRLAKAKKAGRVATSTGTNPRGGSKDSGMDAASAAAMAKHGL